MSARLAASIVDLRLEPGVDGKPADLQQFSDRSAQQEVAGGSRKRTKMPELSSREVQSESKPESEIEQASGANRPCRLRARNDNPLNRRIRNCRVRRAAILPGLPELHRTAT
jgi:hypothetical protein